MSGKLDQSLDDIVKTRRTNNRGGRARARRGPGGAKAATTAAPAGGVSKSTKPAKTATKAAAPTAPANSRAESKIIVTGLPSDVNEQQIKDYFSKTIGAVKRALLTYGPDGRSRGVATIIFSNSTSAVQAATQLNGVKVDNRPMKIEVIVGADQAQTAPVKALGDRIAKPKAAAKAQPKSAANGKAAASNGATANAAGGAKKRRNGRKGGNRPKTKTAEELDAEMVDYFAPEAGAAGGDANGAAPVNGGAQPAPAAAAGGDTGMEDEIM